MHQFLDVVTVAQNYRGHQATPAQVALAWLLEQKPWIVPLFGARKLDRSAENIGALSVVLNSEDLEKIQSAAFKITVVGDRYPENTMKLSGICAHLEYKPN